MRILVAIEPRSYREAIGYAIRHLRPRHEVVIAEPETLSEKIVRLDPELVLHSSRSDAVSRSVRPGCVEFRPYGKSAARVRVG